MIIRSNLHKDDYYKKKVEACRDIEKILTANKIFPDYCEPYEYGVKVSVRWGDWKHDHAAIRYLLSSRYDYDGYVVNEEDGSDCYSADHYIKVAE